jgi:hypothetical protein
MVLGIFWLFIAIICFTSVYFIMTSGDDNKGNTKVDYKSKFKKISEEKETLEIQNSELKAKLAELEAYKANQELVLNWVDPRVKEIKKTLEG